ncbi:MAG: response regulator transcription factor [Cyanobacteria bacterium HKST-UBA03]|nr:response regulator transcription factor [Cyanobacteria bacterium HKST-UBA03]
MTDLPVSVLIVDDDPHIREVIRYAVQKEGMTPNEASNGQEGLDQIAALNPTIIILDILMPEMDGLTMCRILRQTNQTPIIFLSSRDEEVDRLLGLEIGGDDYISKPFSPRELVARIKVILKRLTHAAAVAAATPAALPTEAILALGGLSLDAGMFTVTVGQTHVPLTATEFHLLERFMRAPQKVFTRDELVQTDVFRDIVSDRTIDSHIRRIRKKLADAGHPEAIETVRGFGYKLGATP